jgi:hypothetical protein
MKNLSQTQFFVAALVLALVIAAVAILAQGLKKYDLVEQQAEMQMQGAAEQAPPSTPETISAELQKEETLSSEELEQEITSETAAVEAEVKEITSVTESYE